MEQDSCVALEGMGESEECMLSNWQSYQECSLLAVARDQGCHGVLRIYWSRGGQGVSLLHPHDAVLRHSWKMCSSFGSCLCIWNATDHRHDHETCLTSQRSSWSHYMTHAAFISSSFLRLLTKSSLFYESISFDGISIGIHVRG